MSQSKARRSGRQQTIRPAFLLAACCSMLHGIPVAALPSQSNCPTILDGSVISIHSWRFKADALLSLLDKNAGYRQILSALGAPYRADKAGAIVEWRRQHLSVHVHNACDESVRRSWIFGELVVEMHFVDGKLAACTGAFRSGVSERYPSFDLPTADFSFRLPCRDFIERWKRGDVPHGL